MIEMAIVGLGNPGPSYVFTRHNAGFLFIDRLLKECEKCNTSETKRYNVSECSFRGKHVLLVKPLTYMNLSGLAVREVIEVYGIGIDDILVVYDDMDLPLGKIRIRKKGSAGQHNGMRSVISVLRTINIPRLRIGIGPKPPEADAVSFVLGKFSDDELNTLYKAIEVGVEALDCILKNGFEKAMSLFNAIEVSEV